MKAFFPTAAVVFTLSGSLTAAAAPSTTISGPFTELRQAPVFESPTQALSANWGPALPIRQPFFVEKVYGRWLYGTPEPPSLMNKKDFAKPGWIFSRMLLVPGDKDTLSEKLALQSRAVIYHGRAAWKKLGLGKDPLVSSLDFLEGLTLSQGTLNAFRKQDETAISWRRYLSPLLPGSLFPGPMLATAQADEKAEEQSGEKAPPPLGLSGTELNFLDQEFKVIQQGKKQQVQKREARKLRPPGTPAIDDTVRTALLGRFLLQKYAEMPPLTHEEVDGFIYMRATAMRALQGCPANIQKYWQNRRWNMFRMFRLKSRPEIAHPWMELSLPGGYFGLSARAIDVAGNEAELAFLLVRPLVKEMRIQRKKITFHAKTWPADLPNLSEELWAETLAAQSTKDSANLDVGDEIAVDIAATECISRAGYRPMSGISYLRKLVMKKDEPWAQWFFEHSIGLEYRLERLATLVDQLKIPEGQATNIKRFSTAARYWNLLP